MPNKYTPLENYLSNLSYGTPNPLRLTLSEIESIIGNKLPDSAYNHDQWWGNETDPSRIQARAWQDANYKVVEVDLQENPPSVLFEKIKN